MLIPRPRSTHAFEQESIIPSWVSFWKSGTRRARDQAADRADRGPAAARDRVGAPPRSLGTHRARAAGAAGGVGCDPRLSAGRRPGGGRPPRRGLGPATTRTRAAAADRGSGGPDATGRR